MITSENFVEGVLRTDTPITPELIARISQPETIRLIHAIFGMVTEVAEVADMMKRHLYYGTPLDFTNGKEELGDTMWYIGLACDVMRTTLNEILTGNNEKLKLRYPEKFCADKAVNRDTIAERDLLERLQQPASGIVFGDICGYADVSDAEYRVMNNLKPVPETVSIRGANWLEFAFKVLAHIENYTVPQYGDKGDDQASVYSANECVRQVEKYAHRFGRNMRPGQESLDFMKMAHYTQLALEKYEEEKNGTDK